MAMRRRGSKREGWTMVVRTVTIGSLSNINCLLQDMDCKGIGSVHGHKER
jgi:hypothetical protein